MSIDRDQGTVKSRPDTTDPTRMPSRSSGSDDQRSSTRSSHLESVITSSDVRGRRPPELEPPPGVELQLAQSTSPRGRRVAGSNRPAAISPSTMALDHALEPLIKALLNVRF
ncbi:hypothetical protein [Mycetocola sp.]|uniref:hypothetical protein n=1 Tax=Mycetocola sp. TaxID=1871042 RepID=UPI002605883E|nr:hypothetical protein [Mycetocola sp.]